MIGNPGLLEAGILKSLGNRVGEYSKPKKPRVWNLEMNIVIDKVIHIVKT